MLHHNGQPLDKREATRRVFFAAALIGGAILSHPHTEKPATPQIILEAAKPTFNGLTPADIDVIDHLNLASSQKKFIRWTLPIIMRKESEGAPIDSAVVEAQTILETHFGENAPGNEYFGVKTYNSKKPFGVSNTLEKIDGKYVSTKAAFRHYDSFESSLDDYVHMIKSAPWYGDARQAHGWRSYLWGLQHDRHYFDDQGKPLKYASGGSDYTNSITNVINDDHLVQLTS